MVKIDNFYPYGVRVNNNITNNENNDTKFAFNSEKTSYQSDKQKSLVDKIKYVINKYFKPIDGTICYVDLMPYGVPLNKIDYEA